jgi:hypothetical protein
LPDNRYWSIDKVLASILKRISNHLLASLKAHCTSRKRTLSSSLARYQLEHHIRCPEK